MADDLIWGQSETEEFNPTVRVDRYTLDKVAWCFNGVVAGEPLTKQQRAWLDVLLREAYRDPRP